MKNILVISVVFSLLGCYKIDDIVNQIPTLQTGGELMIDEYLPEVGFAHQYFNVPYSDTLLQVDTAQYWQSGDTVFIRLSVWFATYADPGITTQNQLYIQPPIPTGFWENEDAGLVNWSMAQFEIQTQTATYTDVTARAIPWSDPAGSMRIEVELKREGLQYLPFPENHFYLECELKYILQ